MFLFKLAHEKISCYVFATHFALKRQSYLGNSSHLNNFAHSHEMCGNVCGQFEVCEYLAIVYIARCATAQVNQITCPPDQREDTHDWQEDKDDEKCPACNGETPP